MTAKTQAFVTPEVLLWARDSAGYSAQDVASMLKRKTVSAETVADWESGRCRPTYAQLKKLAEYYKRPIALFYFPAPPQEEPIENKFRSLPAKYAKALPPRIRYLVRKALARRLDLYELHAGAAPANETTIRRAENSKPRDAVALAKAMRAQLGIDLPEQFAWVDADEALKRWRAALEGAGIWVFKDAFRDDNYAGFCLHDARFPLIYINNGMPKQRQIFTLFHEWGHLLLQQGGVDFRADVEGDFVGRYRDEEVFCNAFAGAFLLPDAGFVAPDNLHDDTLRKIARRYKVSREAVLRKCRDRGMLDSRQYAETVKRWRDEWLTDNPPGQPKKSSGGGNYYATRTAYLGDKYLRLVFSQYYAMRIDHYQLAGYLGVKAASVERMADHLLQAKS